jgi:hypothetical protein
MYVFYNSFDFGGFTCHNSIVETANLTIDARIHIVIKKFNFELVMGIPIELAFPLTL